jgi:hypothetical protein
MQKMLPSYSWSSKFEKIYHIKNFYVLQQTVKSTRDQELLGNRKPLFVNCSRYHPTVQEEQPSGTEVIQVTALDPDPPNAGGNVTYTFVSAPGERLKFSIGPVSGLISTSSVSAFFLFMFMRI